MDNQIAYPGTLHAHSDYSNIRLRDSINKLDEMMWYAAEIGNQVFALTDHECISGHIKAEKIYKKIKEKYPDFKLIRGNEIYLCRNGLNAQNFKSGQDKYYHFILLARDSIGHKQIREISTRAWQRSYRARGMRRVPTYYQDLFDIIGANPGHIIASTACLGGTLPTQILRYRDSHDEELFQKICIWIQQINGLFGQGNFYLEMQPSKNKDQIYVNRFLLKLSEMYNIPYIITTDAHYLKKEDRKIHKAYLNAQNGDREVDDFYATTYMMTTEELESFFNYFTDEQIQTAYKNINHIADMCEDYSLFKPLRIPQLSWKSPCLSTDFLAHQMEIMEQYIPELHNFYFSDFYGDKLLAELIVERVYGDSTLQNKETYEAINDNLEKTRVSSEVNGTHWSAYYLNLQKIIDLTWKAGSLVGPGRGCFVPGSKVTMADGQTKNIEDVKIGDYVFTHLGRIKRVLDTKEYFAQEKMYRLKIKGTEDIVCTNNHKLWAIKNIKCKYKDNCVFSCKRNCSIKDNLTPKWIEAQNLQEGDMVAIPRYKYIPKAFDTIDLADYSELIKYHSIDETHIYTYVGNNTTNIRNVYQRYIPVNKDFLYFLGVFIGDGWVRNRDNYTEIGIAFNSYTVKDQKSQKRIEDYLSWLGIKYKVIHNQNGKKVNQLIFHNPFLGFMLKKWCGDGAINKHIPYECLYDNREEMEALLEGLLNSDGCMIKKDNRISYDTINYNLANQVRNLLAYLGLYASIKVRKNKDGNKDSYKVSSGGKQLQLLSFLDYYGTKNIVQQDDKYFYPRIEKITTEDYAGNVYDLSVEEDTSYTINNIAVHNSGVGFILLYILGITQINPVRETTKTYSFRFLNPERVSVLDVDFDSEGGCRQDILATFRKEYGDDRVAGVATFGTEKSKSAILTAARGLGIDKDIALYISSLIPSDRGLLRTLDQCMYGDEENGFAPIKQFVYEMTENYPEIWEVAHKIEGLVARLGSHAGGVIFKDEDFTESVSLMRTPKGEIITAYDLHDVEACGDIKYDVLSVEALDKIYNCLDLLCDYGYIERKPTLKETYENTIGIYNLEREAPDMWEMIWKHRIENLFQMEQQSGITGIALTKPQSVDDLAVLNSVIRLMAPEKGAELPLEMWARYRQNIELWRAEMRDYGLTEEEVEWLSSYPDITNGIAESQECLMKLTQEPLLGGNNLNFADKCRKGLAKKDGLLFKQCEEEFFNNAKEKQCSEKLVHYVWDVLLRVQRNYSFNKSHTLAYSLIALQEMNLAFKYPIIFWDCACLISDSGGNEKEEEEEDEEEFIEETAVYSNEMEEFDEDDDEEGVEDSYEEEDCDGLPVEVVTLKSGKKKKKKKIKANNYGRIASAIGKMKTRGVNVSSPDINESTYTFSPDVEKSIIRFGLSGIVKIGADLIKQIIDGRPYTSLQDFTSRIKISKPQMINLIKAGAFDCFGTRESLMRQYIESVSDCKTRITLQNMKTLIDFGLIPKQYDLQVRVFNFNKYLKKLKIDGVYYGLDDIALTFYEKNFDMDNLIITDETESGFKIKQAVWDKIYKKHQDIIRPFIKENSADLLEAVNFRIIQDMWNKYCSGSVSKWEMDAVSCYFHKHELDGVDLSNRGVVFFNTIPETPEIERILPIKGKQVPLFKIRRIAGTVLDKNKSKNTVTILTNDGVVVTVKIYGNVFAHYDRQISEKGADGKKKVIEKSWFQRGNKVIISGIRQDNGFLAKKYSRTPYPLVELITEINEDGVTTCQERTEVIE